MLAALFHHPCHMLIIILMMIRMVVRMSGRNLESFTGVTVAANLCEILSNSSIYAKLPNHGRGWGVHVRSDIEIYLNILELIHAAAG